MRKIFYCRAGTKRLRQYVLLLAAALSLFPLKSQELFSPANNPRLTVQQQHYLQTIINNHGYVDHEIIRIQEDALDQDALWVALNDRRYQFIKKKVTYRDHDDYSWSGELNGQFGRASIVVNDNMITAILRVEHQLFMIYPLGEGLHVLSYLDSGQFPDDCPADHELEEVPKTEEQPRRDSDQREPDRPDHGFYENYENLERAESALLAVNCRVRLLVVYTDNVAAAYADPHGLVQGAVDDHNDANANSEVNHRVELARSMEVNYNEGPDSAAQFLDEFEDPNDGIIDNIHDDRALFDADVCVFMTVSGGGFCGLASGIGSSYSTAFCNVAAGCAIGNHTFAHEVGHLHGCRHDPFVDSNNSPYAYGHGYVYMAGLWRTIMAYNNECDCSDEVTPCPDFDDRNTPGSPSCTRLQNWSTPDVTNGGIPMGTEATHKNKRVLDVEDQNTAAYEFYEINKVVFDNRTIQDDEAFDIQGRTSVTTDVNDPFTINSGGRGTFRAGTEIILKEGFHAKYNSEFRAYLEEECNALTFTGDEEEASEAASREEEEISEPIPALIGQTGAYPNPFSDKVTIQYRFSEDVNVTLHIYDLFGRLVKTLMTEEPTTAGVIHQFEYDGSGLPAGTYHCVIKAGDFRHTLRLVKIQ